MGSRKCRWPIIICLSVHAIRKNWLSQSKFYSTYYVHQTYTNRSTWHVIHVYQWLVVVCVIGLHFTLEWHCLRRNGQVYFIVPKCTTFTKHLPHVHLYMIHQCHVVVCVLGLYFTFEWPWLRRNCLDYYMSVPAGAYPGIFRGGGG